MRPIHGSPENFRDSIRARLLFPTFSWAFVPIDTMNVPTKFEVRSFTRSSDIGYTQKIWAVHGYAHVPFLKNYF